MSMAKQRARDSIASRDWSGAFDALLTTKRDEPLEAEDLEYLALAAYMLAKDPVCEDAWTRAHQAWQNAGNAPRAARCAFWQALGLLFRGDLSQASGWVSRGA